MTPHWVRSVLVGADRRDQRLPPFRLVPLAAENSTAVRLQFLQPPQDRALPGRLFIKLCPEGHPFLGASEPNYYRRDYAGMKNGPIVKCFGTLAAVVSTPDSLGRGYALILEDLSASHSDNKLIKADRDHAVQLGRALGQLHAYRWGPGADPEGPHDLRADLDRYLSHVERGLGPVMDIIGDGLDQRQRLRLTGLFGQCAGAMLQRALQGTGLTLVHGDPNPTNVLSPSKTCGGPASVYLIDRQPFDWSLRVWPGASDLVLAAVPYWPQETRRALQLPLLTAYHSALSQNGVQNYSWDELLEDWRICSCLAAFTAIEWGSDPISLRQMRWLWEKQLRRALAFLDDSEVDLA